MTITLNGDTGITSPNDTTGNQSYTGTLTGGTGVVNLGSGQFYKDASGVVTVPAGFTSGGGTGISAPNATATTIMSIASVGTYLVTCSAAVSAGYQGVALVSTSASGSLSTTLQTGGAISFGLSGTNLQFTQNSGTTQTLTYWYTKLV